MNVIEQFGSYENAKSECEKIKKMKYRNTGYFEIALLEYRRANRIFEVGDKVVYHEKIGIDRVVEVNNGHLIDRFLWQIRHATDAEIEAGHRL